MLLPIFVGEDWKWNLTFSGRFATKWKILGFFGSRSNKVRSAKVKMHVFPAGKKTETLSLVNRCIFWGLSVQSAIGRAQRQMKQCIQSPCVIKHRPNYRGEVPVFPFGVRNHCISWNRIYIVRKIQKAAQVLKAFVDLTWSNSESRRDLLGRYSFAPLFSKI